MTEIGVKAVIVERFGSPKELAVRGWPRPQPKAGEVLVEAHAFGLNFPDILVVAGKYQTLPALPFVPGKELAGVVTALGDGVTSLVVGDRVMGQLENGAFAETVAVAADHCFKLPPGLPMTKAAAMGLTYQTAWFGLLDRAKLMPGETVLVTGAGGGVGSAAIQIAKARGARVLAGIGSPDKRDFVLAQGADAVIDMSGADLRDGVRRQVHAATDGHGADVVIESVGGAVFEASLRALAWAGRLIVVGFAGGEIPSVKANYLLVKHITVSGLHWSDYRDRTPEAMRRAQNELFDWVGRGLIDPPIFATLAMEEVGAAMQLIIDRKAQGKVVMVTARGRDADPA